MTSLTVDDAVDHLLELGLLDSTDIVEGGLTVTSAARRNRSLLVERRDGTGWLIKQPEPLASGSGRSIAREASFYALCSRLSAAAPVGERLAKVAAFFGDRSMLLLELFPEALPLRRYLRRAEAEDPRRPLPTSPARSLGENLAVLHVCLRDVLVGGGEPAAELLALNGGPPWPLSLHRPNTSALGRINQARYQALHILQSQADVARRLDELRAEWRTETVLHGDVRSENVLVVGEDGAEVRLIDWEFVRRGDPAWDVAGALQDLLLLWLRRLPLASELEPAERVAETELPLAAVRPSLRALWDGYRSVAALDGTSAAEMLDRAVTFSAARLIQSVWETASSHRHLTSYLVLALQTAANILADPAAARADLYGFEPA